MDTGRPFLAQSRPMDTTTTAQRHDDGDGSDSNDDKTTITKHANGSKGTQWKETTEAETEMRLPGKEEKNEMNGA